MIYSLTGFGKGKTEASIGLAIRAIANNENVVYMQFLKDGSSGEVQVFEEYFYNEVICFNSATMGTLINDNNYDKEAVSNRLLFDKLPNIIFTYQPSLVILDEVLVAIDMGLIELDSLICLIEKYKDVDFCFTGRINSHKLRHLITEISDICTDAYCEAHHFDRTCNACGKPSPYRYKYCPNCGEELPISKPSKKGRDY